MDTKALMRYEPVARLERYTDNEYTGHMEQAPTYGLWVKLEHVEALLEASKLRREFNRDDYKLLPMATYPEIDAYTEQARSLIKAIGRFDGVEQLAVGLGVDILAALDGKRARKV